MAAASLDTAIRNALCAGADPHHLALLDNVCWSSGNSPERLYELKEAARACYEGALAHAAPFISGKDSMFNDFKGYDANGAPVHIAAPPTLLVSVISVMKDVSDAMTLDVKSPGDVLYLLGSTNDELGGSEYFSSISKKAGKEYIGTRVPRTDFLKNARIYRACAAAIHAGLISAAIGVSRGGLGTAVAKMSLAGGYGVSLDLSKVKGNAKAPDSRLFSESQGRIVVTVPQEKTSEFEKRLKGIPHARIGVVTESQEFVIRNGSRILAKTSLTALGRAYRTPFKDF